LAFSGLLKVCETSKTSHSIPKVKTNEVPMALCKQQQQKKELDGQIQFIYG